MLTPGAPPATPLQTPVETPRMVFAGLSKTAHVDEIAQELAQVRGRIALTLRAERHREAFVRVFGDKGLAALQRRPLVEELLVGADPTPMLVQLDALFTCGMAEIEAVAARQERDADGEEPIRSRSSGCRWRAAAADAPPPHGAEPLRQALRRRPGAGAAAGSPTCHSPFDDEDEVSGVMEMPATTRAPSAAAAAEARDKPLPDAAVEALRKEVLHEYLGIQGKDYYQVLRLARDAPAPREIAGRLRRASCSSSASSASPTSTSAPTTRASRRSTPCCARRSRRCRRASCARPTTPSSSARRARRRRALDADLLAQKATELLAAGDADGASDLLERAVAAAPDQADYHALLAWARLPVRGRQRRRRAAPPGATCTPPSRSTPSTSSAHEYAGRIAAASGDDERAIDHLTRVLDADPARAEALTDARVGLPAPRRAQAPRAAVPQAHPPPRRRARSRARAAAVVAAGRALSHAARRPARRPRSRTRSPPSWRPTIRARARRWRGCTPRIRSRGAQAAQALRDSWRLQPDDPEPGRALFKLHLDGERWDAAFAVAAALALRGAGRRAADRVPAPPRPRFLVRAHAAASTAARRWLERVRHPDDDRDLSRSVRAHLRRLAAAVRPGDGSASRPTTRIDAGAAAGAVRAACSATRAQQLGVDRAAGLSPRRLRRRRARRRRAPAGAARRPAGAGARPTRPRSPSASAAR